MLLILLSLLALSECSTLRVERDVCAGKITEFDVCTEKTYKEFTEAFRKGDDGRPDWNARKSCNYITAAILDCTNPLIGDCMTLEEVNKMRDDQFKTVLHNVMKSIPGWDSEKCPAVREYLMRPEEAEEKAEEAPRKMREFRGRGAKAEAEKECKNPKGGEAETYKEGCLKHTCKKGVWRVSLDHSECCYEGASYPPGTTITTHNEGSAEASIQCVLNGDTAQIVLQAFHGARVASKKDLEEVKQLLVSHINTKCS